MANLIWIKAGPIPILPFLFKRLFCSNNIIGLGIGNVDRNYPLFGIPTLRLDTHSIPGGEISAPIHPN
jgi:hypothetical protein